MRWIVVERWVREEEEKRKSPRDRAEQSSEQYCEQRKNAQSINENYLNKTPMELVSCAVVVAAAAVDVDVDADASAVSH